MNNRRVSTAACPSPSVADVYLANEKTYLSLMFDVFTQGQERGDRTGTGTISTFVPNLCRYALRAEGKAVIPLLNTKKLFLRGIIHELVWMVSGSTRLKYLIDNDVNIWSDWVQEGSEVWGHLLSSEERCAIAVRTGKWEKFNELHKLGSYADFEVEEENAHRVLDSLDVHRHKLLDGELGPIYGKQWRAWTVLTKHSSSFWRDNNIELLKTHEPFGSNLAGDTVFSNRVIDQLSNLITGLRDDPFGRRHIITAWNVGQLDEMQLPPCHSVVIQFYVREDSDGVRYLTSFMHQRSADVFLGVPFNIAFYGMLTHVVANALGYLAEEFVHSLGDAHIYLNHVDQVREQLSRTPEYNEPTVTVNVSTIEDALNLSFDMITIEGYESQSTIKAPVSV